MSVRGKWMLITHPTHPDVVLDTARDDEHAALMVESGWLVTPAVPCDDAAIERACRAIEVEMETPANGRSDAEENRDLVLAVLRGAAGADEVAGKMDAEEK